MIIYSECYIMTLYIVNIMNDICNDMLSNEIIYNDMLSIDIEP